MKTKITILVSLYVILSCAGFATVRTVSNHPLGGAQYSTLTDAYNAAANGDTLLIEGTAANYNMPYCYSFSKSLVVIGQGINTAKQNFFRTSISSTGFYCPFGISPGGNGSKFYGINFNFMGINLGGGVSNITFENCLFEYPVTIGDGGGNPVSNIVYKNCIFTGTGGASISLVEAVNNLLFSNCIFNSNIHGDNAANQFVTIDHCLFLSTVSSFDACVGYQIKNSIFMNTTSYTGMSNGTMQSNISRIMTGMFPPSDFTDLGGNLNGADPLFVNYTFGAPYSPAHNYHLQGGSPAIGTASDSTDIGVHGGFTKFSEKGEPLNTPVMRAMVIQNTTVAPNGILHVQVEASKPNDN